MFSQFLNKCDLLEKKIQRGVQVSRYITSYGTRPNEASAVAKCESLPTFSRVNILMMPWLDFRQQFKDVFLKQSPERRTFYSYLTSVVVSGHHMSIRQLLTLRTTGYKSYCSYGRHRCVSAQHLHHVMSLTCLFQYTTEYSGST